MDWLKKMLRPDIDEIDPAEAKRRQEVGAILIDVREPYEWSAGHAIGARHIPLGKLEQHLASLPRDREVLFICRSGNRSATATLRARRAGLTKAANVRGGLIAWMRDRLPIAA